MLPDELSEDDSVDMDAEEKAEEEEAKQDKAPTRKSKKGANANLNRQQTKEFNQLIKDSQNLIDELNDMDENHHKDENLCFYHVQKPEEVDKLMDNYDATYENFFKRKDSLLLNINKLSQLHHGEDEHNHEQMIAGAHGYSQIFNQISGEEKQFLKGEHRSFGRGPTKGNSGEERCDCLEIYGEDSGNVQKDKYKDEAGCGQRMNIIIINNCYIIY